MAAVNKKTPAKAPSPAPAAGRLGAGYERQLAEEAEAGFDPARGGRHPLPALATWTARLGRWGIGPATWVVAYDGAAGGNAACRLWWMLRAVGHERVAVLDGGLQAAQAAGLELSGAEPPPVPALAPYPAEAWLRPTVGIETVDRLLEDPAWKVLDVRSRERWLGEVEPFDPVAGRIPGAVNLPFAENLDAAGRFRPAAELRRRYLDLLGGTRPENLAVHCGSGVTACHTLLALELAGLPGASLYVGSYGEWCRSGRPLGQGPADPSSARPRRGP
jgi:thiosulfate/3-mercaptopyruvate sulfurtransferase